MNRDMKRILKRKLGEDFPIDKFYVLFEYYHDTMHLEITDFILLVFKKYLPVMYDDFLTGLAVDSPEGVDIYD